MDHAHAHHHSEKHLRTTEILRDIVIGVSDGLTVPFALAAGLTGAVDSNHVILAAGIAEIVAGSLSMGLGGYLAGKTEVEHYDNEWAREHREVERIPEEEREEIRAIFEEVGLSRELQAAAVEQVTSDKDRWVNFMMRFELGLEKPRPGQAWRSALRIGLSYVVGGLIPLVGYFFTRTPRTGLIYSSILTLASLALFGFYKSKLTGQPPLIGALKVVGIGATAAVVAFWISQLVRDFV